MPKEKDQFNEMNGTVVLLDLQESTFLWDRNSNLAKKVIDVFKDLVETKGKEYGGLHTCPKQVFIWTAF